MASLRREEARVATETESMLSKAIAAAHLGLPRDVAQLGARTRLPWQKKNQKDTSKLPYALQKLVKDKRRVSTSIQDLKDIETNDILTVADTNKKARLWLAKKHFWRERFVARYGKSEYDMMRALKISKNDLTLLRAYEVGLNVMQLATPGFNGETYVGDTPDVRVHFHHTLGDPATELLLTRALDSDEERSSNVLLVRVDLSAMDSNLLKTMRKLLAFASRFEIVRGMLQAVYFGTEQNEDWWRQPFQDVARVVAYMMDKRKARYVRYETDLGEANPFYTPTLLSATPVLNTTETRAVGPLGQLYDLLTNIRGKVASSARERMDDLRTIYALTRKGILVYYRGEIGISASEREYYDGHLLVIGSKLRRKGQYPAIEVYKLGRVVELPIRANDVDYDNESDLRLPPVDAGRIRQKNMRELTRFFQRYPRDNALIDRNQADQLETGVLFSRYLTVKELGEMRPLVNAYDILPNPLRGRSGAIRMRDQAILALDVGAPAVARQQALAAVHNIDPTILAVHWSNQLDSIADASFTELTTLHKTPLGALQLNAETRMVANVWVMPENLAGGDYEYAPSVYAWLTWGSTGRTPLLLAKNIEEHSWSRAFPLQLDPLEYSTARGDETIYIKIMSQTMHSGIDELDKAQLVRTAQSGIASVSLAQLAAAYLDAKPFVETELYDTSLLQMGVAHRAAGHQQIGQEYLDAAFRGRVRIGLHAAENESFPDATRYIEAKSRRDSYVDPETGQRVVLYKPENYGKLAAPFFALLNRYAELFIGDPTTGAPPRYQAADDMLGKLHLAMYQSDHGVLPPIAYWQGAVNQRHYASDRVRKAAIRDYAPNEEYFAHLLAGCVQRNGLTLSGFVAIARTQLKSQDGSALVPGMTNVVNALIEVGTRLANSANYKSDVRWVGKDHTHVDVENFGRTLLEGIGNADDCEGQEMTSATVLRMLRDPALPWKDAPMQIAQQVLCHFIFKDTAASVTSAFVSANDTEIPSTNIKKLPKLGSPADRRAQVGGHCHGLAVPNVIAGEWLANGNASSAQVAAFRHKYNVSAPWQRKLGVLVLEGTGPIDPRIGPLEREYEGAALSQRQWERALRKDIQDHYPDLKTFFHGQSLAFHQTEHEAQGRRISTFYRDVAQFASLELYAVDHGLSQGVMYNPATKRWGVSISKIIADGRDGPATLAIIAPYANETAHWDREIVPLLETVHNQMPQLALGRWSAPHQVVPQPVPGRNLRSLMLQGQIPPAAALETLLQRPIDAHKQQQLRVALDTPHQRLGFVLLEYAVPLDTSFEEIEKRSPTEASILSVKALPSPQLCYTHALDKCHVRAVPVQGEADILMSIARMDHSTNLLAVQATVDNKPLAHAPLVLGRAHEISQVCGISFSTLVKAVCMHKETPVLGEDMMNLTSSTPSVVRVDPAQPTTTRMVLFGHVGQLRGKPAEMERIRAQLGELCRKYKLESRVLVQKMLPLDDPTLEIHLTKL